MKQTLLHEKYPVFTLEIDKEETEYRSVDEVLAYLKERIDQHRIANYIATFDHFSHTQSLPEGRIDEEILDAKNIIFCFGITIPNPQVMAVRPRSIGVVELASSFVVTFMEAPMPIANSAMDCWAKSIKNGSEDIAECASA